MNSQRLIKCLLLSRLIVLTQLQEQIPNLSSFDWLCYQRSRRTQQLFEKIFGILANQPIQIATDLFEQFKDKLRSLILIFDESQHLLKKLVRDYHSLANDEITDFQFEHPRSLFSFLARFVVDYESIWCGTHMGIRNMELFSSAAGGKPDEIFVFTDFNYLQPHHIAKLLEKFLSFPITDSRLLHEMCHFLQGRPRFISQYLINLVTTSRTGDKLNILQEVFKDYRDSMTSLHQKYSIGSLYKFWEDRYHCVIGKFKTNSNVAERKLVSDILLKLCVSYLFSDSPDTLEFDPETADMVSTGLVMISKVDNKYRCFMAEPMSLFAGLNYFAAQKSGEILLYFSSQLFTSTTTSQNLSPQERGNLMELVIAVRFLQGWWMEPQFEQYLPKFTAQISTPCGIINCRNAKNTDYNYFFHNLEDSTFPFLILPSTNAAPDISFSIFKCYVKTTWSANSKTSIYVASGDCKKNVQTMNPANWYKGSSLGEQCQKILKESQPKFIHLRFELPFTAPSSLFNTSKSDNDDTTTICVDLSKPFAKEFFGANFVDEYKKFITSVVEDTSKLKFAS